MHKITAKQSRAARSLLKWNIYDLANAVKGIPPKRIDSFEHAVVHLAEWEYEELIRAFKKAGILFRGDLEVALHKELADPYAVSMGTGEGARIVLDADQTVLSDDSLEKMADFGKIPPDEEAEEEKKDGNI